MYEYIYFGYNAQKINTQFDWQTKFIKYRVSDNNNSADAGGFHRDIICCDVERRIYPVFTVLHYFDVTQMEVIPGSHLNICDTYYNAVKSFSKYVRIQMSPGDILIFYSSLLHRGVFTERKAHRRLIQIFEVYRCQYDLEKYGPKFLHIRGDETHSKFMINASAKEPFASIINWYSYLNAYTGYGYKSNVLLVCGFDTNKYIYLSSEGLRKRIEVIPGELQPINKYIINEKEFTIDLPSKCNKVVRWLCYDYNFLCYSFILFAMSLIIVLLMLHIVWVNISTTKQKYLLVNTIK